MTVRTTLLIVTSVTAGALATAVAMLALRPQAEPAEPRGAQAASESGRERQSTQGAQRRAGMDVNLVRAVVASEVRSALAEQAAENEAIHDGPAADPAEAEAPEEQAAEEAEAAPPSAQFAEAKLHVQQRVAEGSWGADDRDKLGEALGFMTPAERKDIMLTVIRAANKGELRVDLVGPLF